MLRRFLHIAFSLWLAIILLFGVTPKEILHACANHRDTIHKHDVKGATFEKEHHHCQFLGFTLDVFSNDIVLPYISLWQSTYVKPSDVISVLTVQRQIIATALRGPPTA